MIFTIIGIGLLGVVATLILKEIKPSLSIFVPLATCIIISLLIMTGLKDIFDDIHNFVNRLSLPAGVLATALKVAGVGYLIEFAADIAEESGLNSIAHKITLAGKIVIASICLPYVFKLFDTILGLI